MFLSHFKDYIEELTDKQVLETIEGFVTYSYPNKDTVYIENIYIIPERRETKAASALANRIAIIARERGCTKMLGSVQPLSKNSTRSLEVLLGFGMRLLSSNDNMIWFTKEI